MECDGFRLGTMCPHVEAERNKPENRVEDRGMEGERVCVVKALLEGRSWC